MVPVFYFIIFYLFSPVFVLFLPPSIGELWVEDPSRRTPRIPIAFCLFKQKTTEKLNIDISMLLREIYFLNTTEKLSICMKSIYINCMKY